MNSPDDLAQLLAPAVTARLPLLDGNHQSALRLFNGFTEGFPTLSADLYGHTLVLHNYEKSSTNRVTSFKNAELVIREIIPWIRSVVHKSRHADDLMLRKGLVSGDPPEELIQENGILYAIDLCLNQDTSFYLDTRNLRTWLKENAASLSVLNTFAYTGSLGAAALAGGAASVIHVDLNSTFLDIAARTTALNKFNPLQSEFLAMDFFSAVGKFKKNRNRFDCILLDPPFFSKTSKASIDMNTDAPRLINKVRPLLRDHGILIMVNNALFLRGFDFLESIRPLCTDGYLEIEAIIPVPQDMCGFPHTIRNMFPADPSPFNHPTKILVLRILHSPPHG